MPEHRRPRRLALIAIALLIVAAFVARSPLGARFGGAMQAERVSTGIGRRASVELPDGTRAELGVASTLVHPPEFAGQHRTVVLSGDAYFTVATDSARPFVVTATHAEVETIGGTAFAVRALPGAGTVRVVVAEGQLMVRPTSAPDGSGTTVGASQLARITRAGAVSRENDVPVERYTAWRRGRIIFAGAPLREALVELGRWYDVDLRIRDSVVANRRVTAEFATTQTLTEVLDEISLGIGAVYDFQGRIVTFRRER